MNNIALKIKFEIIDPNLNIIQFSDGKEAFEYFLKVNKDINKDNITLMIIDHNMITMNGDELSRKVYF